jgi:predicted ATPase
MIDRLSLKNFKSIIEADVKLGPFTVLIGANGSGKSNLIQALAFLAAIPSSGVAGAVNRFGGFSGIVPKAIPSRDLRRTRIGIHHRRVLPGATKVGGRRLPPAAVDHELELAYSPQEIIRVASESMTFHQALATGEAMQLAGGEELGSTPPVPETSAFVLSRGPRGGISYWADPPITRDTLRAYLYWLGLPFLGAGVTSVSRLREVLASVTGTGDQQRDNRPRNRSFLDPDSTSVVDYALQFRLFRSLTRQVRAYDLLLSELRYEQPVSDSRQLSPVGLNMPSVVRRLSSNPQNRVSWNRILNTLGAIAPHVLSMQSRSLRTGKEFIEFVERSASREVESWESSDGTLRALAILLALETHGEASTILIEEPEQNLHPWAIRAIVDHIREAISERRVQVIVTTHSPQVLERVRPSEVLIAQRTEERGTEFRTLAEILPDSDIVMGEVADLWVKGLLGGVPSDE